MDGSELVLVESSFRVAGSSSSEVVTSTSELGSDGGGFDGLSFSDSAVKACGSGDGSILPATISHNQSAIPSGTISTAVCGL